MQTSRSSSRPRAGGTRNHPEQQLLEEQARFLEQIDFNRLQKCCGISVAEDVATAFKVLCDAAKAHRARIQDLEQELTRCTADFQTSQLQRAALQEQVRELEAVFIEKIAGAEAKAEDAKHMHRLHKEVIRLQQKLSQRGCEILAHRHSAAELKQQLAEQVKIAQDSKAEAANLREEVVRMRQQLVSVLSMPDEGRLQKDASSPRAVQVQLQAKRVAAAACGLLEEDNYPTTPPYKGTREGPLMVSPRGAGYDSAKDDTQGHAGVAAQQAPRRKPESDAVNKTSQGEGRLLLPLPNLHSGNISSARPAATAEQAKKTAADGQTKGIEPDAAHTSVAAVESCSRAASVRYQRAPDRDGGINSSRYSSGRAQAATVQASRRNSAASGSRDAKVRFSGRLASSDSGNNFAAQPKRDAAAQTSEGGVPVNLLGVSQQSLQQRLGQWERIHREQAASASRQQQPCSTASVAAGAGRAGKPLRHNQTPQTSTKLKQQSLSQPAAEPATEVEQHYQLSVGCLPDGTPAWSIASHRQQPDPRPKDSSRRERLCRVSRGVCSHSTFSVSGSDSSFSERDFMDARDLPSVTSSRFSSRGAGG